jgi:hypothetical protein
MKLKHLLILNSVVSIISGLSALLIPARILLMYGIEPNTSVSIMAQYSGLGSIAIGLITWFLRNIEYLQARATLIPALMLTHFIGLILSIYATVSGIMSGGWPVIVIYSIFFIGYLYMQVFKRK